MICMVSSLRQQHAGYHEARYTGLWLMQSLHILLVNNVMCTVHAQQANDFTASLGNPCRNEPSFILRDHASRRLSLAERRALFNAPKREARHSHWGLI
jgi:hypothetical protein